MLYYREGKDKYKPDFKKFTISLDIPNIGMNQI